MLLNLQKKNQKKKNVNIIIITVLYARGKNCLKSYSFSTLKMTLKEFILANSRVLNTIQN